jgi:hypothetical protein
MRPGLAAEAEPDSVGLQSVSDGRVGTDPGSVAEAGFRLLGLQAVSDGEAAD